MISVDKRKARTSLVWRGIKCRITITPNFLSPGWTQLEIEVVGPKGAPLPITDTGYRAHYLDAEDLIASGGAVAFFTAWLDREARTKRYAKAEFHWRQLSLF